MNRHLHFTWFTDTHQWGLLVRLSPAGMRRASRFGAMLRSKYPGIKVRAKLK